jgi:hypothetical protein|tara:strand:+ start:416 stop:973 length:558 start_codon:yes stop_codon:yes gene_type:complete
MPVTRINMKKIFFISFLLSSIFAKELYITRSGNIDFFSSTPIEDIKAINNQVSCVLDKNNGQFAFQIPIKAFAFKNALMQEHFNESYLESDIYPKAVFKGKVLGWDKIELSKDSLEVFIEGDLTMHGETNQIKQSGVMWLSSGSIRGECVFNVNLVDYNVKVPKIVRENIAEIIKVNVSVELKKK